MSETTEKTSLEKKTAGGPPPAPPAAWISTPEKKLAEALNLPRAQLAKVRQGLQQGVHWTTEAGGMIVWLDAGIAVLRAQLAAAEAKNAEPENLQKNGGGALDLESSEGAAPTRPGEAPVPSGSPGGPAASPSPLSREEGRETPAGLFTAGQGAGLGAAAGQSTPPAISTIEGDEKNGGGAPANDAVSHISAAVPSAPPSVPWPAAAGQGEEDELDLDDEHGAGILEVPAEPKGGPDALDEALAGAKLPARREAVARVLTVVRIVGNKRIVVARLEEPARELLAKLPIASATREEIHARLADLFCQPSIPPATAVLAVLLKHLEKQLDLAKDLADVMLLAKQIVEAARDLTVRGVRDNRLLQVRQRFYALPDALGPVWNWTGAQPRRRGQTLVRDQFSGALGARKMGVSTLPAAPRTGFFAPAKPNVP